VLLLLLPRESLLAVLAVLAVLAACFSAAAGFLLAAGVGRWNDRRTTPPVRPSVRPSVSPAANKTVIFMDDDLSFVRATTTTQLSGSTRITRLDSTLRCASRHILQVELSTGYFRSSYLIIMISQRRPRGKDVERTGEGGTYRGGSNV